MECFSLREGASKPISAFFSILIVLLSPVIFCKALAFPLQQLANRYSGAMELEKRIAFADVGFREVIFPIGLGLAPGGLLQLSGGNSPEIRR